MQTQQARQRAKVGEVHASQLLSTFARAACGAPSCICIQAQTNRQDFAKHRATFAQGFADVAEILSPTFRNSFTAR
jgi:hypothetical protein